MIQLKWKYIWPYLVFIITIGVAVGVNVKLIEEGIKKTDHAALTINQAGRQRFLSQRLASDVLLLKEGKQVDEFESDLITWNRVHRALQEGDTQLNIEPITTPGAREQFANINPLQEEYSRALTSFRPRDTDATAISNILRLQEAYVQQMDKGVYLLQQDTEAEIKKIRDRQIWAAFFSGLALILEILFLVVPYHKKLIVAYAQLKYNKKVIEEQSDEIQQQMYMLEAHHDELARLNGTMELTLEGINAGVWDWNIVTGKEQWSPKFFKVLGYDPGELPATFDTFLNVLLHPDDKAMVEKAISRHLEHDEPYHLNIRMRNKNGNYRWYEAAGKAAKNIEGGPVQMAGSIIDITDKVKYQNQLEEMNQAKDKIFAIISHDLRSPLNGVKGLIELQSMGALSQQQFEEYMGQLKDGVDFTLKTLDNMLVWAMAQMDSVKVEPTNVEMDKLLGEVEQFHRQAAKQKEHEITYKTEKNLRAYVDANHLFVIVRNLVGNAIKFTPNRGRIDVTAALANGKVAITVQDNGLGMKPEHVEKILNGQHSTPNYGTNGEKGTGLGMSLVLDLLQMNGGKLSINSEEGKGTTMTATIPAEKALM